jgi:TonB family protein
MIKYFTIVLLILPFYTFGQDIETIKYFLNEDRELCDSASATYILTVSHKKGTTAASTKITTKEGTLVAENEYSDLLRKVKHGKFSEYYTNGQLELNVFYKNDKLDGEFTTYYPDGTLKRKDIYQDDIFISGKCYTAQGKDTTYYDYLIVDQYLDGGINNLRKRISEKIKYPKWAKRNEIEGEVIISFVVGKDGIARDFKVLKPVHTLLDSEALRVVSSIGGKWSPAYKDGNPINLRKMLPIKFSLDRGRKSRKKE